MQLENRIAQNTKNKTVKNKNQTQKGKSLKNCTVGFQ